MSRRFDREAAEARFRSVFCHLGAVTAYARRRGSRDADGIAAEVMTIAWRRLADVPADDPRPWLYATARNLVFAEWRESARVSAAGGDELEQVGACDQRAHEVESLDEDVTAALAALSPIDREALLL